MVEKGLDDLVQKYSQDETPPWSGRVVNMSAKISMAAKLKLDALSRHVGVRKTPLIGEIAEAAINDLFERLYDEMDEDLKQGYAHSCIEESL